VSTLAVVMPVFNRPQAAVECLESVAAQTRPPAEVVVVDDGSTDDTPRAVRGWLASRSLGRLIESPWSGAPAARNVGLRATTADVLGFLDSDDLWPEDFAERAMAVLEADPQAVAATADVERHRPGRPPKVIATLSLEQRPIRQLFIDAGIGSATLVRRTAIEACGGYDERTPTGHDLQLYLRLALLGRWRHVGGTAVTKREGIVGPRLSDAYRDRDERWAQICEDFAEQHPQADRDLSKLVGRRWFKTARAFRRRGAVEEARRCYCRAVAWRPLDLRARWGLASLPRTAS
jgi:glycosyltransferase involved in cell wall biosynthesis